MMTVDDQPGTSGSREVVDNGEPVRVTGWRLMRHQNVEALAAEAFDIVGKNRIAVP